MTDPYRYFRIEARELTDELNHALTSLSRGAATAEQVGAVLRHAHTLKGAARVVAQAGIADNAHFLEELLEPYRSSGEPITTDQLDRMQALVDEIRSTVEALHGGSEQTTEATAETVLPQPGSPDEQITELATTARASLADIDAIINGVLQARSQLAGLRQNREQIVQLRAALHVSPGPARADRLRKIANLDIAAEQIQRALSGLSDRMDRELRQTHDTAERLRLVPVETIVPDLERGARDVAVAQGKRVAVDVVGGRIRLDAPVLATAQVALRQIVRNAVAHGIETPDERLAAGKAATGQVRLDISQHGDSLIFSCTDDGRGIDLVAVRRELERAGTADRPGLVLDDDAVLELLTHGGVSTAAVVSEISGRGIGLDVVRDAARQLGGRVSIRTAPGRGTTIDLISPLSLTAQDVILVDAAAPGAAEEQMALPLGQVQQALRVLSSDIGRGPAGETLIHRGVEIPFLPLAAALGDHTCTSRSSPAWSVLLLATPRASAAIGVRRLSGAVGAAIHAIPELAPVSPLVGGVWIDIDGRPRIVLDTAALVAAASRVRQITPSEAQLQAPILIVDDSLTTRMLEQSILEAAGYRVELASSAEEGLAMAESRPFALVLVDVEMPGMDGFGFVEQTRLRPQLRHLPCILITSRASAQDRRRGLEAGARAHLDKGEFYQGALLERISELLAE